MNCMETSLLIMGGIVSFFCMGAIAPDVSGETKKEEPSAKNGQNVESSVVMLFEDPDDIHLFLPVKNSAGIVEEFMNLTVNKKMFEEYNYTADQVKAAWIEHNAEGGKDVIINGVRHELTTNTTTIISLIGDDGKQKFLFNLNHFQEQTMKDIEDDPFLIPLEPAKMNWIPPPKCNMKSFLINVTSHSIDLHLNGVHTATYKIAAYRRGQVGHSKYEGLLLSVVNPHTCNITMDYIVPTSDVGGYRDLLWGLESIAPGKIVLVASLRDGASFLNLRGRKAFMKMGSFWAKFYIYRDSWLTVFIKGGKIVHDVLIPNLGHLNCSGSPLSLDFDMYPLIPTQPSECLSWPHFERWEARKIFCQLNDGFSTLCDCDQPFEFRSKEPASSTPTMGTEENDKSTASNESSSIPLIIITGNKTRHLFHLLQSLAPQPNLTKEDILLVSDGHFEQTAQLAFVLGIQLLVHRKQGNGSATISMNLRFALFQALKFFPRAESFIVLEDDLILSPDFYSYMNQMAPIFEMDKSIYAVSAFNHLSYPHTSGDPTLTYRVECYPAYGWMMPRYIVKEILPLWLPANFSHDWDFFVGSSIVRKERECVIPDINRSYHWSTKGFHNTASYMAERFYLSRGFNKDSDVILQPLERLLKDNYDREMTALLNQSIPVTFNEKSDLEEIASAGNTYAVYLAQHTAINGSSFRLFAEEMGLWTSDIRDHYNFVWRFLYKNATILVVAVPISPYSYFMPKNHTLLVGNATTDEEIKLGEFLYRMSYKHYTHFNSFHLPKWEESSTTVEKLWSPTRHP